jgi:hypothetical protein
MNERNVYHNYISCGTVFTNSIDNKVSKNGKEYVSFILNIARDKKNGNFNNVKKKCICFKEDIIKKMTGIKEFNKIDRFYILINFELVQSEYNEKIYETYFVNNAITNIDDGELVETEINELSYYFEFSNRLEEQNINFLTKEHASYKKYNYLLYQNNIDRQEVNNQSSKKQEIIDDEIPF